MEIAVNEGEEPDKYFILSNHDYNRLAEPLGKKLVEVKENQVIYNFPYNDWNNDEGSEDVTDENKKAHWSEINLNIGEETKKFKLDKEVHGQVISLPPVGYSKVLVLNDKDFEKIIKNTKGKDLIIYNGIKIDNWKDSYDVSMQIQKSLGDRYDGSYYSNIIPYKELSKVYGLILFIGFFIAFLFFIASGSIIYFKLFNELKHEYFTLSIFKCKIEPKYFKDV
jgi:putative ABC transport system permease protein